MSTFDPNAEPQLGRPRNGTRTQQHTSTEAKREPQHEEPHTERRRRWTAETLQEDQFSIPMEQIPEGLTYEWKRWSANGEEYPFYIARMREQGWEPVPPSRHPDWVPPGYDKPHILKSGLVLMDRPAELTRQARDEAKRLSKRQLREAEQRLGMTPKDTMTRNFPGVEPRLEKQVMRPIAVEE